MKNQNGFTLIEWMIYFALISFVLTGIFHFVATTQKQLIRLSRKSSIVSQLCGAQDGIAHDIAVAPVDPQIWTTLSREHISWKKGEEHISWFLEKGTLYRSRQQFDKKTQSWKKKRKAVVVRDLESVQFIPNYKHILHKDKNILHSFMCKMQKVVAEKSYNVERTVLLRNRILV